MDKIVLIFLYAIIIYAIIKAFSMRNQNLVYYNYGGMDQLVRDLPNKQRSAELLSEIKVRLKKLIKYCAKKHPQNNNVKLMNSRFQPERVKETGMNETGTSYTINKSDLHLCLRDKKSNDLHGINILMFVSIHELAHVMSSSYGHNEEFSKNFIFLLNNAKQIGVYNPVNYSQSPQTFCGIQVDNSPLF